MSAPGVAAMRSSGSSSQGVTGLGQSSWGPTGFAFVASAEEGEALLARLRANGADICISPWRKGGTKALRSRQTHGKSLKPRH